MSRFPFLRPGWLSQPDDPPDIRLEKDLLLYAGLLTILASGLWGVTYLVYGEPDAALLSLLYLVCALLGLVFARRTGLHRPVIFSLLVLGMAIPWLHTITLGGFWSSGLVFIWALIPPIGALFFYSRRTAAIWGLAYLLLLALGILFQPAFQQPGRLPQEVVRIFFLLNLGSVSGITLTILGYFIRQKNEAYRRLDLEEQKSEALLENILPRQIAARLKEGAQTIADQYDEASILFADLVSFTPLTARLPAVEIVRLLDEIFSTFDELVELHGVEKIQTIGDGYMVAAGAPIPQPDHAHRLAALALEMQATLEQRLARDALPVQFRIGINSGPVIGGVIGRKKFGFHLWGDAVNTASRMESHGEPGKIHISQTTYHLIRDRFECEPRGRISIKGKGEMETWFLLGPKAVQEHSRLVREPATSPL